MKHVWRSVLVSCALLLVLLACSGCTGVSPDKANVTNPVATLGASNGFVLLRYPNGDFYVVRLEYHDAYKVDGLPRSGH